jgi:hypothetical protein
MVEVTMRVLLCETSVGILYGSRKRSLESLEYMPPNIRLCAIFLVRN